MTKRNLEIQYRHDIPYIKWQKMKDKMIKEANYMCVMCHKQIIPHGFSPIFLTIHHIIPRNRGGKSVLNNLVCLCCKCHDIAEEEKLNAKQIKNYYENNIINEREKFITNSKKYPIPNIEKGEKIWHTWVYGGFNKPEIEVKTEKYNFNIIMSREETKEKMLEILKRRHQNYEDWDFEEWFEKKFNMILKPFEQKKEVEP